MYELDHGFCFHMAMNHKWPASKKVDALKPVNTDILAYEEWVCKKVSDWTHEQNLSNDRYGGNTWHSS